ncbi:MAG: rhomboid family intramembrane serine protease [Burkholderiales bacterium]|nr:rhomboid family intramembrane serine protease [Burkholderiales bacterium]
MRKRVPSRAWAGVCALIGLGALLAGVAGRSAQALEWDAVGWVLRPWTLWTSAWVHASAGSLAGNLLALAALAVLGTWLGAGRHAAVALLVAWPATTLALLLWPEVARYGGLGGVVHAAAMVLWARLALRGSHKPLSFALFCGVGIKLLAEGAWLQPVAFDPGWGGNVVYAAHLAGAVAGAACGLLCTAASEN